MWTYSSWRMVRRISLEIFAIKYIRVLIRITRKTFSPAATAPSLNSALVSPFAMCTSMARWMRSGLIRIMAVLIPIIKRTAAT